MQDYTLIITVIILPYELALLMDVWLQPECDAVILAINNIIASYCLMQPNLIL